MGKGANVQISNVSSFFGVYVSFRSLSCMYNDGTDGSDFGPISGGMEICKSLPPSGTQYIEAINSGSCFTAGGSFVLIVEAYGDAIVSFTFNAHTAMPSSWGGYSVNGGSYAVQQDNYLKVSVTIASNGVDGSQDVILVIVHDAPKPS